MNCYYIYEIYNINKFIWIKMVFFWYWIEKGFWYILIFVVFYFIKSW